MARPPKNPLIPTRDGVSPSCVALPLLSCALVLGLRPTSLGMQALTTLILITPMGPLLYRLAFRPLADATAVFSITKSF